MPLASWDITFFHNEAEARGLAEANGGEADGFRTIPAPGRPGWWMVEVFDPDDGLHLGAL